jgi:geranylgeranyl pyrophosphate synthase
MDLQSIFAPVLPDMERVDRALRGLMAGVGGHVDGALKEGILPRIISHPFAVPGKRLRPAMVLISARAACAGPRTGCRRTADAAGEEFVGLASAVEVLHAASLVHDDIIDEADSRRNQVSLNRRFGNRVAVLAGDILYTHFFGLIMGLPGVEAEVRIRLLGEFLRTTETMCLGEIIAQEAPPGTLPLSSYLEITADKTAVLFSACCRTAAILCGAAEPVVDALGEFGMSFGLAFQMVDDLMDGDSRIDPSVDLRGEALTQADGARARTAVLAPGAYRDALRGMVDFVIAQAIP